ncbi:MAG: primosomal protein N' [Planctomycetes bacterium]|nr:primosomal protein N' [Planctomycetota bacterium]
MTQTTLFQHPESFTSYVKVAPERGVDHVIGGLTYGVPATSGQRPPAIGQRVLVPLGRGNAKTPGYVVGTADAAPDGYDPDRIKPILRVLEDTGCLSPELVRLGSWMASYYCCPLGMVLANMLPASVRKGTGRVKRKVVRLAPAGRACLDSGTFEVEGKKLTRLQKAILEQAGQLAEGQSIEPRDLVTRAGGSTTSPVTKLVERRLLEIVTRSEIRASWQDASSESAGTATGPPDFHLTDGQTGALEAISHSVAAHDFAVHALYGVTGSGKTEVYLRAIDAVLAAGRSVIVLVPEISLTPQTVARFRARLGDDVAVLHSGLTSAQRHQQWASIEKGDARVVVGARSAVFAPFPDPAPVGLIVVDEEHDSSYKQDQAPRYHARDVAIKRAQMLNAVVVLGSATPSMETCHNAVVRRLYTWHRLPERVPGMNAAVARIVDMAADLRLAETAGSRQDRTTLELIGPTLQSELGKVLEDGGKAIVLLNRRGYANLVCCPSAPCAWVLYCDECDAAMVLHKDRTLKAGAFVQCHHCQAEQRVPKRCPMCDRTVRSLGVGTQRLEEVLCRLFPDHLEEGTTLRRVDSDTMRRAADYHEVLDAFRAGQARVLLGTQILAKGHDFPDVRLVGVINADAALHIPDFRSAERTFQLITQVAGRAGRGEHPGTVIVQTWQPEAPAVRLAAAQDYRTFGRQELTDRQQAGLPPYSRLARIVVRHQQLEKAQQRAEKVAAFFRKQASHDPERAVAVHGPMPCALGRIAGQFRIAIELQSQSAGAIQQVLAGARNRGLVRSDAQTAVDVDPITLM